MNTRVLTRIALFKLKITCAVIDYLVLENRQAIVAEIAIEMDISASSVETNVVEKLDMKKNLGYIGSLFERTKGHEKTSKGVN